MQREAERSRVFVLVRDLQAGDPDALRQIDEIRQEAAARGWGEVERACLFADVVAAWLARTDDLPAAIGALLRRSEEDHDLAMVALALAMRSDGSPTGEGPFVTDTPDADLARSVVLLEEGHGGVLERISAHTACGIAFGNRWLWELGHEQYAAALKLGAGHKPGELDFILGPVAFNRGEDQVAWAGSLRQLGDPAGIAKRRDEWGPALKAALSFDLPAPWRRELSALGLLLEAIDGEDVARPSDEMLAPLAAKGSRGLLEEGRSRGHLLLAKALSDANAGRPEASASTREAIEAIVPEAFPHMYDLALFCAAEVEAGEGRDAGLRYAQRQLARHWATRVARLGAMTARIDAERLAAEHQALSREVNLDDLTGISNRRGMTRYLEELFDRGERAIALILIDLDNFKEINDNFGHGAGDSTLFNVARVLEDNIRHVDAAVRLGGDEFAMVLAGAELDVAMARAHSLMRQLGQQPWDDLQPGLVVTASIGVAIGTADDIDDVNLRADAALYEAKGAGGNRVVGASNPKLGR